MLDRLEHEGLLEACPTGEFLVRQFTIQDILFVAAEAESFDRRETLLLSNLQHRAIAEAMGDREGTRAEAIAREHGRNFRRSVTLALRERRLHQLPGGSLVRIPEAV